MSSKVVFTLVTTWLHSASVFSAVFIIFCFKFASSYVHSRSWASGPNQDLSFFSFRLLTPTKWSNTLKQFFGFCQWIFWVCLTILFGFLFKRLRNSVIFPWFLLDDWEGIDSSILPKLLKGPSFKVVKKKQSLFQVFELLNELSFKTVAFSPSNSPWFCKFPS